MKEKNKIEGEEDENKTKKMKETQDYEITLSNHERPWFDGSWYHYGGAPKVREELHGSENWRKEWRQVGRHLQVMESERGDKIS